MMLWQSVRPKKLIAFFLFLLGKGESFQRYAHNMFARKGLLEAHVSQVAYKRGFLTREAKLKADES